MTRGVLRWKLSAVAEKFYIKIRITVFRKMGDIIGSTDFIHVNKCRLCIVETHDDSPKILITAKIRSKIFDLNLQVIFICLFTFWIHNLIRLLTIPNSDNLHKKLFKLYLCGLSSEFAATFKLSHDNFRETTPTCKALVQNRHQKLLWVERCKTKDWNQPFVCWMYCC